MASLECASLRQASIQGYLEELKAAMEPGVVDPTSRRDVLLDYDSTVWRKRIVEPQNTLQIFVTDVCNLRCKECFYANWLGSTQMSFEQYRDMVSIRIGVHGLTVNSANDKPLVTVRSTDVPVTMVFMVAPYNVEELMAAAYYAEDHFNCQGFYISSIHELDRTGDFWKDTERTLPMSIYARAIQAFVRHYQGGLPILHLGTRGILVTKNQNFEQVTRCRFASVLGDGTYIIAPLDISLKKAAPNLTFDEQPCSRHHKCVLQKIVLARVCD